MVKDSQNKKGSSNSKSQSAKDMDNILEQPMEQILNTKTPSSQKPSSPSSSSTSKQQNQGINNPQQPQSSKDSEFYYQKLEKKFGLSSGKDQKSSNVLQQQQQQQQKDVQQSQPKTQRHISEFKTADQQQIDPFMQASHLDYRGNEAQPDLYKYLDGYREFRPQINIGQRWGHQIQQQTINSIEYEQSLVKGKGFLWKSIKMGKLGVDLFFIGVGITGIFLIPFLLWQRNEVNKKQWIKSRGITREKVPDYEEAGYDLDDVSREENMYNMFQKEIIEEKSKKLVLHNEISNLMNMLFPNK